MSCELTKDITPMTYPESLVHQIQLQDVEVLKIQIEDCKIRIMKKHCGLTKKETQEYWKNRWFSYYEKSDSMKL